MAVNSMSRAVSKGILEGLDMATNPDPRNLRHEANRLEKRTSVRSSWNQVGNLLNKQMRNIK